MEPCRLCGAALEISLNNPRRVCAACGEVNLPTDGAQPVAVRVVPRDPTFSSDEKTQFLRGGAPPAVATLAGLIVALLNGSLRHGSIETLLSVVALVLLITTLISLLALFFALVRTDVRRGVMGMLWLGGAITGGAVGFVVIWLTTLFSWVAH